MPLLEKETRQGERREQQGERRKELTDSSSPVRYVEDEEEESVGYIIA